MKALQLLHQKIYLSSSWRFKLGNQWRI